MAMATCAPCLKLAPGILPARAPAPALEVRVSAARAGRFTAAVGLQSAHPSKLSRFHHRAMASSEIGEDSSAVEEVSAEVPDAPAEPSGEVENASPEPAAEEQAEETIVATASTTEVEEEVTVYERDEQPVEPKPRVVYPKGFTRYETMAVFRPNISEEGRTRASQKYEEMIIAGGGLDVEVFNRGIMPLGYRIIKKNSKGEKNAYVDGIYYMFTYATKPAQIKGMERKLQTDDDIIRAMTLKT